MASKKLNWGTLGKKFKRLERKVDGEYSLDLLVELMNLSKKAGLLFYKTLSKGLFENNPLNIESIAPFRDLPIGKVHFHTNDDKSDTLKWDCYSEYWLFLLTESETVKAESQRNLIVAQKFIASDDQLVPGCMIPVPNWNKIRKMHPKVQSDELGIFIESKEYVEQACQCSVDVCGMLHSMYDEAVMGSVDYPLDFDDYEALKKRKKLPRDEATSMARELLEKWPNIPSKKLARYVGTSDDAARQLKSKILNEIRDSDTSS